MAQATSLAALSTLGLSAAGVPLEGVRAILASSELPSLWVLELHHAGLGEAELASLLSSPGMDRLDVLGVGGNVDDEAAARLVAAAPAGLALELEAA